MKFKTYCSDQYFSPTSEPMCRKYASENDEVSISNDNTMIHYFQEIVFDFLLDDDTRYFIQNNLELRFVSSETKFITK